MKNTVTFKMEPGVTEDSDDLLSIPHDLSQFLGNLDEYNPDINAFMNQTFCEDPIGGSDWYKFDIKAVDGDASPAATAMLDGNPAPPSAVRVEEPYLNTYVNSAEMEPPSPEIIHVQNVPTGTDDLEPTGIYPEPIYTNLQQPTCGSMVQADSMTSLQPASPAPMMQVNDGPSSTGFVMQDFYVSYIQPASPGDFLNSSSGANEQPTLTVISATSPIQPANPVQPTTSVFLAPPSLVDPVLPSNIKKETNTIAQELSVGPKKRGRKPKYPDGMRPKRRRPKKTKIYEMYPLNDPVKEKRRRNAVNAKIHRDKAKQEKETLAQQLKEVMFERDQLMEENKALKACLQVQYGDVVA